MHKPVHPAVLTTAFEHSEQKTDRDMAPYTLILELLEVERMQEEDKNEDDSADIKHVPTNRLCTGTLENRASGGGPR